MFGAGKTVGGCAVVDQRTYMVDVNSDGVDEPMIVIRYQSDMCGSAMDKRDIQLYIFNDEGQLFEIEHEFAVMTQGQLDRSVALFKTTTADDADTIVAAAKDDHPLLRRGSNITLEDGSEGRIEEFYFTVGLLDEGDHDDLYGAKVYAQVATVNENGDVVRRLYDMGARRLIEDVTVDGESEAEVE